MINVISKYARMIAIILIIDILSSIIVPSINATYALTSGPSSPEFSSFEPVATTNLVDPFSGSFTYNLPVLQIPGSDGGGYALSLSYHSGTSSEQESSWVGHGWTLNPGAINRNVRGIPDEFEGEEIDKYNKTRANWSITGSKKDNLEVFSKSIGEKINIGISNSIRYNNNKGLNYTNTLSLGSKYGGLSMNESSTGVTFSAHINPFAFFAKREKAGKATSEENIKEVTAEDKDTKEEKIKYIKESFSKDMKALQNTTIRGASESFVKSLYSISSFTDVGQSTSLSKLSGFNFSFNMGAQINPAPAPVGVETGYVGTFNVVSPKNHHDKVVSYGYLNTKKSFGKHDSDYFTEKNNPFDDRDYFIGIPFSSPDNYVLSGEGLSGGFRPYRTEVGHYSPYKIDGDDNKIKTFGVGLEFMVGSNFGIGVNLAFGGTKSSIKDWSKTGNSNDEQFNFNNSKDYHYRFIGDKGGSINYGDNSEIVPRLEASPNFPGIKNVNPTISDNNVKDLNNSAKRKTSSHISKQSEGYDITSESGLKYEYGASLKVRNTANISIDANIDGDEIENNYFVYKKLHLNSDYNVSLDKHKTVLGEVNKIPYEKTSLIQSIKTSDYVKIGDNELPDDDDFGGWTTFEYHKKYGDNNDEDNGNKWYRWRIPYNGMFYNMNSISDRKDDVATVSTGEKEVSYLKKIETKTHIAYFITNTTNPKRFGVNEDAGIAKYLSGSNKKRLDGLGASSLISNDPHSSSKSEKNMDMDLEYLEKIVLFAKGRLSKPLQTTYFSYDYSLVSNLPNSVNGNHLNPTKKDSGKLTLKKVWSEFEGVVNARISPYKFDYKYKDYQDFPKELVAEHKELTDFFNLSNLYSINSQNPEYTPYSLDAWGNNQYDGKNRHAKLQKGPYQGNISKDSYDPAAWQLKQITLPSGGQILVDYESNDYRYVQDRDVMGLVSLEGSGHKKFKLNLSDIGYEKNDIGIKELKDKLHEYFVNDGNKIYFKFLYALQGESPYLSDCKSEYITGYVGVEKVDLIKDSIEITLNSEDEKLLPKQSCVDFYSTNRVGQFEFGCEGDLSRKYHDKIQKAVDDNEFHWDDIKNVGTSIFEGVKLLSKMDEITVNTALSCMKLNPSLSYFKIPINKDKRGGGVRVNRVLMYDKGIENGDAAIYGKQFKYQLENGISSGVATNEPKSMREENPLVGFLFKEDKSWLKKMISGRDKEQTEGPIGESLLPSPSVGYSRVIVQNIHTGKTGMGHTVNEFYTCKDYPYDHNYDYSLLSGKERQFDIATSEPVKGVKYSNLQKEKDKMNLPTPIFSYSSEKAWASQGFRFIVNTMHGKPKASRTYGGVYTQDSNSYVSAGKDYYYFEPGEQVKMLKKDGTFIWDTPGKQMDVTLEKYRVESQILDFNFEIDTSVGLLFFPPIFASGWVQFGYSNQMLSKYSTSKVIEYPSMLKKVVSYDGNISSETENLAFDYSTGSPILTKSYDAYHKIKLHGTEDVHDGSVYKMNIPAHWNYQKMGMKSKEESNTNQLTASSGEIITYGKDADPINLKEKTWSIKNDRVVSASAKTFNSLKNVPEWMGDGIQKEYKIEDLDKFNNIWRYHKSYAFKENTSNSSSSNQKSYKGGIMKKFVQFDYQSNMNDNNWIKLSEVTKYSPNGNVLEEYNTLNIPSASRYGYSFTQPVILANNATYEEIYFQSFEDESHNTVKGETIENSNAHTGVFSKKISSGTSIIPNLKVGKNLSTKGGELKFWINSDDNKLLNFKANVLGKRLNVKEVSKVGKFSLCYVFIKPEMINEGDNLDIVLNFDNEYLIIDDIKFTPYDSKSTCYVYDHTTLKLLAIFGDQHYGMMYQYNDEGKLIRKLIETERGLKVITENQYNTPKTDTRF